MSEYKIIHYDSLDRTQIYEFESSTLGVKLNQHYLMNSSSVRYYDEYFGSSYANRSLILLKKNEPVLILPALCKKYELNFFDEATEIVSILEGDDYDKAVRIMTNTLKKEAEKLGEIKVKIKFDPIILKETLTSVENITHLLDGYVNCSLSEANIKSVLRKSYKPLINWGKKNLLIKVLDAQTSDYEGFLEFKNLHIKASGRKTRSDLSWDYQFEMIKLGKAYLISAFYNNELVSGCFIMHNKNTALYGVAASDRKLMSINFPLNHYTLWKSILIAKDKGCKKFILGNVSNDHNLDEKANNIALFKRGFASHVQSNRILNIKLISKRALGC